MDRLLAAQGGPRVKLSSTGIPDRTRKISVAADDMLINALNRMNRHSRRYVFLDQALVKDSGIIDLAVVQPEDPPRPNYYVRGAISQLDDDAAVDRFGLNWDEAPRRVAVPSETRVTEGRGSVRQGLSVVSVDLHLVGYPSRQVLAGASVSNSMVVRERSLGASAFGLISLADLDFSVQVERVESRGQAVRNLIEISLIELIGRHARVPYWTCLASPAANPQRNGREERRFQTISRAERVRNVQMWLARLGFFKGEFSGEMTPQLRTALAEFQARQHIVANGIVDFDTWSRLRIVLAQTADLNAEIGFFCL